MAVLSLTLDIAKPVLNHLQNGINASPILKSILVATHAEGVDLRHPSGRTIEIRVVAGRRAGGSTVARWLCGLILDEAPRMLGESDAVVNYDEARESSLNRILPGGQILSIGSPYAPEGPIYDIVTKHAGKPSPAMVVAWGPAWVVNPAVWTDAALELAREDPDTFATDVEARFASKQSAFFDARLIDESVRQGRLAYDPRNSYSAFIDPASRTNAFTFIIVTREGSKCRVVLAKEWIGTRDTPLDTGDILTVIGADLEAYRVPYVESDGFMGDALASQARERGFDLVVRMTLGKERLEQALHFRTKLVSGEVELCTVDSVRGERPYESNTMALDMRRVRRKATQNGAIVDLPQTSDGRHCDFAPCLLSAMRAYLDDRKPEDTTPSVDPETLRMREEAMRRFAPSREDDD